MTCDTGWVLPCHPAGWSKAYAKTGQVYYRNKHDKTTTWDRPVLVEKPNGAGAGDMEMSRRREAEKKPPAQTSGSAEKEQPLPPGKLRIHAWSTNDGACVCRSYLPEHGLSAPSYEMRPSSDTRGLFRVLICFVDCHFSAA